MIILAAILLLGIYIYLGVKLRWLALLSCPIATIAMFVMFSYYNHLGWYGEIERLLGVALIIAIIPTTLVTVLLTLDRQGEKALLRRLLAVLVIGTGIFASAILVAVAFSPLGAGVVYGTIFFFIMIAQVIRYLMMSRQALAAQVMGTIGSCMRQNLPLATALKSAGIGRTDRAGDILQGISSWLVEGYPLSEAIRREYPQCPGHALAMIELAERIDQVPTAIKCIEEDILTKTQENKRLNPVHPLYPLIVFITTFSITTGIMYFVIPKFAHIFWDFDVELPQATRILMTIFDVLSGWIWLLLAFITFVLIPLRISAKFKVRRANQPGLLMRIGDFIKWHLPILHWFEWNYSLTRVVELLRLSLKAGVPIDQAIAHAVDLDVNTRFRRRLRRWHRQVEQGHNIADAARANGLGKTLAWAFDDEINRGNTPAILETLESFYRSNYNYKVNLARFILWPGMTIAIGALVSFAVFACFCPLVQLIEATAAEVTP